MAVEIQEFRVPSHRRWREGVMKYCPLRSPCSSVIPMVLVDLLVGEREAARVSFGYVSSYQMNAE